MSPLNQKLPQMFVVASLTCSPSCQRRAGFVVPCDGGYHEGKVWSVAHAQIMLFCGFPGQVPGRKLHVAAMQLVKGIWSWAGIGTGVSPVGDFSPPTKFTRTDGLAGMSLMLSRSSMTKALYAVTVPAPACGCMGSAGNPNIVGASKIFATNGGVFTVSVAVTGVGERSAVFFLNKSERPAFANCAVTIREIKIAPKRNNLLNLICFYKILEFLNIGAFDAILPNLRRL